MTHPIHYSAARILIGFAFVGIATCNAATITVTSLADSGSGSLRAAVTSAAAGDTMAATQASDAALAWLASAEVPPPFADAFRHRLPVRDALRRLQST